jgi:hypothetical protein
MEHLVKHYNQECKCERYPAISTIIQLTYELADIENQRVRVHDGFCKVCINKKECEIKEGEEKK